MTRRRFLQALAAVSAFATVPLAWAGLRRSSPDANSRRGTPRTKAYWRFYDSAGKFLFEEESTNSGETIYSVEFPRRLQPGRYHVQLFFPDGTKLADMRVNLTGPAGMSFVRYSQWPPRAPKMQVSPDDLSRLGYWPTA